jgi:carbon storage regulator CsrA
MLILTRRLGDSVVMKHPAGDIVVTYLSSQNSSGSEIRMGFDAPKEINIVRSEIIDRYPSDIKEKTDGN